MASPGRPRATTGPVGVKTADRYLRKRVPEVHRKKGAAFPVRYLAPDLADQGAGFK